MGLVDWKSKEIFFVFIFPALFDRFSISSLWKIVIVTGEKQSQLSLEFDNKEGFYLDMCRTVLSENQSVIFHTLKRVKK